MTTNNELGKFSKGTKHMKRIAVKLTLKNFTNPEKPVIKPAIKKRSFLAWMKGDY